MNYKYKITNINKNEHWISLSSDGGFDCEEPDSFICLLKRIRDDIGGSIEDIGEFSYRIYGDGIGLIYQWDSCFGISVMYPNEINDETAMNWIEKYLTMEVENE